MKPGLFLRFCIFLILTIGLQNAFSQCSQTLRQATLAYENGQINEVPGLLENCLADGFTKQEKIEAYKLMTLSYLYYNELDKARESMQNFLSLNPEYKINEEVDPAEFETLYNTFRTSPIVILGAKVGGTYTNPRINGIPNDFNSLSFDGTFVPQMGLCYGASAEIPFSKHFSFKQELVFTKLKYVDTTTILDYSTTTIKEYQSWLVMPLLLQYNIGSQKMVPFVNAGVSLAYLLRAGANPERLDVNALNEEERTISEKEIDLSEQRTKFNYAFTFGAGVRSKDLLGRGYLIFDVRYRYSFVNLVEEEYRSNEDVLTNKFFYTAKDMVLDNLVVTLGYSMPIYKPRQKDSSK